MQLSQKPSCFIKLSSIFMMMTLAFLTVSLPFVYQAKQIADLETSAGVNITIAENEEENDNPFANTTEEKPTTSITAGSEEYLHETHSEEQYLAALSKEYLTVDVSIYNAFIGELVSPPPDAA
jgi:hypothetical protein